MTGIIHLHTTGRMSRRAVVAGVSALAIAGPVASPVIAQTPVASPVTRGGTYQADARDRLRSLLALVPAEALGGPDPTSALFSWLDLQALLFARGIVDPASAPEGLAGAIGGVASNDDLLPNAMNPETRDALGFSALEVHQILVAGVPPDRIAIYAGGVDFADLVGTWEATGYERRSSDHGDFWTLGEDGAPNMSLPAPLAIGAMNNVALLADDIAVFTRTRGALEAVLALHATGEVASAADDAELDVAIDALPVDTVNVMAFPGDTFRVDTMVPENPGRESSVTLEDLLAESDDAVGPMPPLLLGMFGVTSGVAPLEDGTPPPATAEPRAFMAFLTGSEADAEAAAKVAFWRLENMQSPTTGETYHERFVPTNTPEDAARGRVMMVMFGPEVATSGAWSSMVLMRDTWPFAWLAG